MQYNQLLMCVKYSYILSLLWISKLSYDIVDMCFITWTWLRYVLVFAIPNQSVVCNVRAPYSGGCNFRQYFFAILYLSHPLTSLQNFTEIVSGKPLPRGH